MTLQSSAKIAATLVVLLALIVVGTSITSGTSNLHPGFRTIVIQAPTKAVIAHYLPLAR